MKKDLGSTYRRRDIDLIIKSSSTLGTLIKSPSNKNPTTPIKSSISPKNEQNLKRLIKFPSEFNSPNRSLNLEGTSFSTPSADALMRQVKILENERSLMRSELAKYKEENFKLLQINQDLKLQNSNQQCQIDDLAYELDRLKSIKNSRKQSITGEDTPKSFLKSLSRSAMHHDYLVSPKMRNSSLEASEDTGNMSTTIQERRLRLKQANKNYYYKF